MGWLPASNRWLQHRRGTIRLWLLWTVCLLLDRDPSIKNGLTPAVCYHTPIQTASRRQARLQLGSLVKQQYIYENILSICDSNDNNYDIHHYDDNDITINNDNTNTDITITYCNNDKMIMMMITMTMMMMIIIIIIIILITITITIAIKVSNNNNNNLFPTVSNTQTNSFRMALRKMEQDTDASC